MGIQNGLPSWNDQQQDLLRELWPAFTVWYVHRAKGPATWHACPHSQLDQTPRPVLEADSPEHLVEAMADRRNELVSASLAAVGEVRVVDTLSEPRLHRE
jgi:hypothetical protein